MSAPNSLKTEFTVAIASYLVGLAVTPVLGPVLAVGVSEVAGIAFLRLANGKDCSLRGLRPYIVVEHGLDEAGAERAIVAALDLLKYARWDAQALIDADFESSALVDSLPFESEYTGGHLREASHTVLCLVTTAALEQGEHIQKAAPELFGGLYTGYKRLRRDVDSLRGTESSKAEREQKLRKIIQAFDRDIRASQQAIRGLQQDVGALGQRVDFVEEVLADQISPDRIKKKWLEKQAGNAEKCFGTETLSTSYVPLLAEATGPSRSSGEDEIEPELRQNQLYRRGVLDIIAEQQVTVLSGDPGSGKSSFAQHVCLALGSEARLEQAIGAEQHLLEQEHSEEQGELVVAQQLSTEERIEALKDRTPVYLRASVLAQCLDKESAHSGWMILLTAYFRRVYLLTQDDCERLARVLVEQRCVVLIDGLDEVRSTHVLADRRGNERQRGDDRRAALLAWLNGSHGLRDWPEAKFLLTSRPYGYRQGKLEFLQQAIDAHALAPLLYQQMTLLGQQELADSDDAKAFGHALQRLSLGQRALLSRPLLLTLAVGVFRETGQKLPADKAGLYEACVALFLQRWPKRKFDYGGGGSLAKQQQEKRFKKLAKALRDNSTLQQFRDHLGALARETHGGSVVGGESTDISYEILQKHGVSFARQAGLSFDVQDDFCDYLAWHTGLLIERQAGEIYAFAHRSFQEYLAACDFLVSAGDAAQLASSVLDNPDQWRDVLILAVGRAHSGETTVPLKGLVEQLLEAFRQASQESRQRAVAVLAVALDELIEAADKSDWASTAQGIFASLGLLDDELRQQLTAVIDSRQVQAVGSLTVDGTDAAAVGRVLGWLGDRRPGVGVVNGLPDIAWLPVTVPAHWQRCEMVAGDSGDEHDYLRLQAKPDGRLALQDFAISRYLITHDQFDIFECDPAHRDYIARYSDDSDELALETAYWPIPNHPREMVSWNQAMGFCDWLTERLQATDELGADQCIRLPTEWEWHFAVSPEAQRGSEYFPWGDEYQLGSANIDHLSDSRGRTAAVGLYPTAPGQCSDAVGNVWSWCSNSRKDFAGEQAVDADRSRSYALRGGSFDDFAGGGAALGTRFDCPRSYRFSYVGLCVVRSSVMKPTHGNGAGEY